jgi:hypothetical protein
VTDWQAERQRRAEEAWRRAERLGAFLEVGRIVQVGDEAIELVATLADATQTVVAYRAPAGSDLFPSPLRPSGGASGTVMGDLLVAHLPPAEGSTVLVTFDRFDYDGHEVELPIDRARTRAHERRSVRPPQPFMTDGAQVTIRGATVGLLTATIDVEITSDDPSLTAAALGSRGFLPHPHRQAGSGPLWRDWFPPPEPPLTPTEPNENDESAGPDAPESTPQLRRSLRASASATAKLRFTAVPEGQQSGSPPAPPMPVEVRALPGGQVLATQGLDGRGGPVPDALSMRATLRFDPPPYEASALELVLDELFIFRRCGGHLVEVPTPPGGETVELGGRTFVCGSQRVDLVRWEPGEDGATPRLVVRLSHPGLWPDIRVVADNASVSLWLRPTADDELAGGLPGMYNPLFPADRQVTFGLRMLGRKANMAPIAIPLTPAHTP